jgi:colicin import membrane protein
MDETKQTEGLPSVAAEKAPEGSEGTTPETEAKTYSEEELQKALQTDRVKRGRDDKSFELREKNLTEREQAIKEREAQQEAAELEEARRDPEKMRTYQAKQTRKQQEANLNAERDKIRQERADIQQEREALQRDKVEHEAEIKAARENTLVLEIWRIAKAEGVDPEELKDTMADLNLTTVEQAKAVAKRLSKKPKEETAEKKATHDSLVTSGHVPAQGEKALSNFFRDQK